MILRCATKCTSMSWYKQACSGCHLCLPSSCRLYVPLGSAILPMPATKCIFAPDFFFAQSIFDSFWPLSWLIHNVHFESVLVTASVGQYIHGSHHYAFPVQHEEPKSVQCMLGADSANQAELGLQQQTDGYSTSHGRPEGHTSQHASQQLNSVSPFLRCCFPSSLSCLASVSAEGSGLSFFQYMHSSLIECSAILVNLSCCQSAATVCVHHLLGEVYNRTTVSACSAGIGRWVAVLDATVTLLLSGEMSSSTFKSMNGAMLLFAMSCESLGHCTMVYRDASQPWVTDTEHNEQQQPEWWRHTKRWGANFWQRFLNIVNLPTASALAGMPHSPHLKYAFAN